MSLFLYRIGWWRFMAWFFGAITNGLERLHDRFHPERVEAYECGMCEDRWSEMWDNPER